MEGNPDKHAGLVLKTMGYESIGGRTSAFRQFVRSNMVIENNRQKGKAGLSLGIAYFGTNGYTVSIPLDDTQWYDFIVEKDGIIQTVQCKFTASKDNTIDLRSTGGTNGGIYDNVLKHPLDILFCADKDMNLWVIPMDKVREAGNQNSFTLKTTLVGRGFETYSYLVKI